MRYRHHQGSKVLAALLDELDAHRVDIFKRADGAEVTVYAIHGAQADAHQLVVIDHAPPHGGWDVFIAVRGATLRIDDTVAALRARTIGDRPSSLAQTPE